MGAANKAYAAIADVGVATTVINTYIVYALMAALAAYGLHLTFRPWTSPDGKRMSRWIGVGIMTCAALFAFLNWLIWRLVRSSKPLAALAGVDAGLGVFGL